MLSTFDTNKVFMTSSSVNKKVLIVDDEPNIVKAVDFLLTQKGFRTKKAFNGKEALSYLSTFKPDLIILDVMMPDMDGFEVAKHIRSDIDNSHILIIFLTAKGTQGDKIQGYADGGDMYIIKPFDNEDLIQAVQESLIYG